MVGLVGRVVFIIRYIIRSGLGNENAEKTRLNRGAAEGRGDNAEKGINGNNRTTQRWRRGSRCVLFFRSFPKSLLRVISASLRGSAVQPGFLNLPGFLLAAAACGPGKPVLLYVPPSVHADDRSGGRRPTEIVSASSTFWEAMANLDTAFVASHAVSDSQRAFARALGLMMSGNTATATTTLDSIIKTPGDSLVKAASRRLITAMLQHQENWKALHELGSVDTIGTSTDDRAK